MMPHSNRVLALALVLATALAGCVTPGAADDDWDPSPQGQDPAPVDDADDTEPEETDAPEGDDADASGDEAPEDQEDDADAPPEEPQPVEDAPEFRVETMRINGTITGIGPGGDVACCRGAVLDGDNLQAAFTPGTDAAGLLVELTWTDDTHDLDLTLEAPDYAAGPEPDPEGNATEVEQGRAWIAGAGGPGSPDHHALIRVTDADALALEGDWTWRVHAKSAVDVPFTVHVSVFRGGAPADGWTATTP